MFPCIQNQMIYSVGEGALCVCRKTAHVTLQPDVISYFHTAVEERICLKSEPYCDITCRSPLDVRWQHQRHDVHRPARSHHQGLEGAEGASIGSTRGQRQGGVLGTLFTSGRYRSITKQKRAPPTASPILPLAPVTK